MKDKTSSHLKKGRAFLRISTEIIAEISDGDCIIRNARLENLSADGLAFVTTDLEKAKLLKPFLNVRFSLPYTNADLLFKVEQKNRNELNEKTTISCVIVESTVRDRRVLNGYLRKSTELGTPYAFVQFSALLCCIDSLLRILSRIVYRSYLDTQFGQSELASLPMTWLDLSLVAYLLASFLSFIILSGWIRLSADWRRFPVGIALLSLSAIFLGWRLVWYALGGVTFVYNNIPALFFWVHAGLFSFVTLSIVVAIPDIARVRSVFSAIKKHNI